MPRLDVQLASWILLLTLSPSALAQLPDAPQPEPRPIRVQTLDANYIFLGSLATIANFGDFAITVNKTQSRACVENNSAWLIGAHPSPARAYSIAFAQSAAALGGSYLLKRSRHKRLRALWPVPLLASGSNSAYWWYRDSGVYCHHAQVR